MKVEVNIGEILKYLPHRYPFLLIDRVTDIEKMKSIEAYKNITFNEPCFTGHFPDNPVFPGVLIVEAMAQACCVLGFYESETITVGSDVTILFVSLDKVRFKKMVIPGDKLEIKSELVSERRNFWKFKCTSSVDGKIAAQAEIVCTFIDSNKK